MTWERMKNDKLVTIYADLYEELFPSRMNKELAIKEVLVITEVLKRDFTKRQLCILGSIMTFSYFHGKESALIPRLSDFELAGISKTKINAELTRLVEMNVIKWVRGKDYNEFSFNDPNEWKSEYHKKYNRQRSTEIFFLNLKHAGLSFDLDELLRD